MDGNVIAIFEFKLVDNEIRKISEKHYKLVDFLSLILKRFVCIIH
jgi:hypothetical protein